VRRRHAVRGRGTILAPSLCYAGAPGKGDAPIGVRTILLVLLAAALPVADCDGSPGARDAETDAAPDAADASGDAPPDETEADDAGEVVPDAAPTPCALAGEARVTTVGFLSTGRYAPAAVRLRDGRVLAAGGWSDSSSPSASTGTLEVYDPAAGTWTMLPVQLARPRHDHAAVRLSDCRVIVVGGQQVEGSGAPDAPAEVELIVVPD